jgi:small conductance mechanosensitive channel
LLGGFAAGVMLMIFRPFQAGDVVNAAGQTGKVDEIDLFTTTLITPDNRKIIVPNGEIYGGTIENMTTLPTRRVDVAVGASYDADIDQTKRVLLEAVAATPDVLSDPAPVIYLNELGSSSVDYAVRAWARTGDYWAVKENLTRNIKYKLDAASIGIPYPQMDVHVNQKLGH